MSASDSTSSEKLNNCDTCDKLKNSELDETSNYSTDCEDFTSCSDSLGNGTKLDSLRLNFNGSRIGLSNSSSRNPALLQNKTFSTEKIREIERRNAILVDKILYHNRRPNQYKCNAPNSRKATSSEINRRRYQEKVSRENEILLKKIQSVKPAVRYT